MALLHLFSYLTKGKQSLCVFLSKNSVYKLNSTKNKCIITIEIESSMQVVYLFHTCLTHQDLLPLWSIEKNIHVQV